MSFKTDLDAKKIDELRNRWRLNSPLRYYDEVLQLMIEVPDSYVTNFATLSFYIKGLIIRIPFLMWLLGDLGDAGATVHDWIYTMLGKVSGKELTRAQGDAILRRAWIAVRVPKWRAWLGWLGVRCFGWTVWAKIKRDIDAGTFTDPIEQTIF